MGPSQVVLEREGKLARITLNRPQQLNALGRRAMEELEEALATVQREDPLQILVITGAGEKAFAAGADIQELAALPPQEAEAFSRFGQQILQHLEELGKPSIAAVNGLALGAGCELAVSCSLRIASETARFGQPEVNLGIIPGWGGTQRLPRLIGRGRALSLILTGEIIDAREAYRIGLVDGVVAASELQASVEKLARDLLQKGPIALRGALAAVTGGGDRSQAEGMRLEATIFGSLWETEDRREGLRAFLEKRQPDFQGR
jgi:enoyl-CoA hydratase